MPLSDITHSGTLPYGHKDDQGNIHRDFTLRQLTLADMEAMADAYPELMESENWITRRRLTWAYSLSSLGTLPPEAITPELLATLPLPDFNALADAEDTLEKKCKAAYGRPEAQ